MTQVRWTAGLNGAELMNDCDNQAEINVDQVHFKWMNVQVHLRGEYPTEIHTGPVNHLLQSVSIFYSIFIVCAAGPHTCLVLE